MADTLLLESEHDLKAIKCLTTASICKRPLHTKVGQRKFGFVPAGQNSPLTDANAIAWLLASDAFSGKAETDSAKAAQVLQWASYSQSELVPFLHSFVVEETSSKKKSGTRDVTFQQKLRRQRTASALDFLNNTLATQTFFVGNRLSLADIILAVDLLPAFLSKQLGLVQKQHVYLRRWHDTVVNQTGFRSACDITKLSFESAVIAREQEVNGGGASKAVRGPLKILCLHGYRQNERSFREKLGAFRKIVGKRAELTLITAPHCVPPLQETDAGTQVIRLFAEP